jgi:hypothetical protein
LDEAETSLYSLESKISDLWWHSRKLTLIFFLK